MNDKKDIIIDITTDIKLVKYVLNHIPLSEELKNNLNIIFIATNFNAMRRALENGTSFSEELCPNADKVTQQNVNTLQYQDLPNNEIEVFNELHV